MGCRERLREEGKEGGEVRGVREDGNEVGVVGVRGGREGGGEVGGVGINGGGGGF